MKATGPASVEDAVLSTGSTPAHQARKLLSRPAPWILGLTLLLGIALARITSTYRVFNHTIDEGSHVACGIEWLEKGKYDYDLIDTPIPRVTVALLPYWSGVRGFGKASYWEEGALVLAGGGHYWRTLTLARISVLPFFVLATVLVFLWSRRIYGYPTALLAAGIFTMMPVVLAHSGLATTDIIFTSFFLTAVYAFTRWLEAPSLRTAVVFGFAVGLSAASKFSTLVYLPVIIGLTLLLYFASKRQPASTGELPDRDRRWGPRNVAGLLRTTAIVLVCAFVVIWASYRFSHAPLNSLSSAPDHVADKAFGSSSSVARRVHVLTSKLQIPASEYYGGIRFLRDQNRLGRRSYLFGKMKEGGWWYFYIVSLGLKTPISALLLAIVGGASLAVTWSRSRVNWQQLVPLAGAVALIIATIPSRINIGVRHVMPIFGFLSMLAAWGVVALWNAGSDSSQDSPLKSGPAVWVRRVCAVVLVVWLVVSSVRSHPDYLSYFNEFGGSHPENLLIISDVDWGQDLTRLSTYLKKQQAEQVSILYVVVFDAPSLGLPPTVHLHCGETATGWVAIEERYARVYPECAQWIAAQPVHAEVGKTMRVYYLPRPEVSQP